MKLFDFGKSVFLLELAADDLENARYDPNKDKINQRRVTDTRKEVLTLGKLNKLKKIRALNKYEAMKRQDLLGIMYGKQQGGGGGSPFG